MAIPSNVERTAVTATAGRRFSVDDGDGDGDVNGMEEDDDDDDDDEYEDGNGDDGQLPPVLLRLRTWVSEWHSRDVDAS